MTDWAKLMREDWDRRSRQDPLRHVYRLAYDDLKPFYQEGKYHTIALTFPFMQKIRFDPAGKRVLEVGCGMGRLFPGFKELGFAEIWGIDVSQEMLDRGRMTCPVSDANFILGDGETLQGLESGYFDFCISYNVFSCLPTTGMILAYLDEIKRVLRPGGAFQLHFRRGYLPKARLLRALPARLRSPAQATYHLISSLGSNGLPGRSLEAHYAVGNLETWLGASLPPRRVVGRLARLGMTGLTVYSSPLDNSDGETFWVAGMKPDGGKVV